MPLSPAVTDPYSTTEDGEPQPDSVPAAYAALIAGLLAVLAAYLAPTPGVGTPVWATRTLALLPRFRTQVRWALAELAAGLTVTLARGIDDVVRRAGREAAADTRWGGPLPGVPAGTVRDVADALTASHLRIQAVLESTYRDAVNAGMSASGDPTHAIQHVLDELARRGITGYTDRAGRRWSLEHYVETTVRARFGEAALSSYLDVCRSSGVRFAQISINGSIHKACLVWEGLTVSLDGSPAGVYWVPSRAGRLVEVRCAGTLADSRAAGVWHPWCQHRLTAVVPGGGRRSRRSPSVDRVARAQRRYMARTARAWRRRQRVALTPQARDRAQANTERWTPRREQGE